MMDTLTARPFTAASFNQFLAEKKLAAARCTRCGALFLPPRAICPKCRHDVMEWVEVSGRGKLAAYTSIYIGPAFMVEQGFNRENPYLTGIVALEEGIQISARITGLDPKNPAAVQIGAPVQVEFLEHGEGDAKRTFLAFRAGD
jgi:uncharacterized OB-fold protein